MMKMLMMTIALWTAIAKSRIDRNSLNQHNLILFNKPFGVLSQFSGAHPNLSDFIDKPGFYVAGRLDKDSEGLLLLTNNGSLQARISQPKFKMKKTYWVQVEGEPGTDAIDQLERGIELTDGLIPAYGNVKK